MIQAIITSFFIPGLALSASPAVRAGHSEMADEFMTAMLYAAPLLAAAGLAIQFALMWGPTSKNAVGLASAAEPEPAASAAVVGG
jgi:hypothetical protein